MLDDRKAAILRAVVAEYIDTAQPVGSSHVATATGVAVSPATIRNEMAVLEREGYLVQPHTSAGRIPTDKGYRFFVDQMTGPGPLAPPQRQQVRDFFAQAHGELEQMLHDTSRLLSAVTSYTAVVIGPAHEAATIRSVQLVSLAPTVAVVVAVLSNGVVEKRTIEFAEPASEATVAEASIHLARHLVGSPSTGSAPPPIHSDGSVASVVAAASSALAVGHDDDPDHVFVGGASSVAATFDAVETVRQVLTTLEQQYVVVTLLRDVLDRGLSVAIGTEHGVEPLAECSVVVAPYEVDGQVAGTVGVLGPTRMNYSQALAAVAVVGQRLGKRLTEG